MPQRETEEWEFWITPLYAHQNDVELRHEGFGLESVRIWLEECGKCPSYVILIAFGIEEWEVCAVQSDRDWGLGS